MSLALENITFSYNSVPVLNNITREIDKGEFIGLVGPNGSGKSTLIKCINGILTLDGGKIKIEQEELSAMDRITLAKKIGYVPQERTAIPQSTVFDTILLGRKPHIKWKLNKADKQIVIKIIKQLNLESIAMKSVRALSGGERQKVFIARALAQEPDILLLDEPTANLDINHQIEVMELMRQITRQNYIIIAAIHDINLAIQFCSGFIMLKSGNVFASGGKEILKKKNIESLYNAKVNRTEINGNSFFIPKSSTF